MKVIYKSHLEVVDHQTIKAPSDAVFIFAALQFNKPTLWYECDNELDMIDVPVGIVGTGGPVPENMKHLGTVEHGMFIWHIYVEPNRIAH